jgi:ABC-type Mn2+/Zn2+ transport system ATPase subunit
MEKPLLILDRLAVGYESQVVLGDVNFALQAGSITGLLGTNGSGKSTLLKTILGILPPVSGRVVFGESNGHAPILGYVPQREALDPVFLLSSFEVVLMGACGRVGPGRFVGRGERGWAHHCLREVGADDLSRQQFSQLSGGQRQRVLIARALATRPDLLLLDEPTAGIDANATQAILELLCHLHGEHRLAILMVNHDLTAVRKTVEQVLWLHQGKVLFGPVAELLSREKIEEIMELELD